MNLYAGFHDMIASILGRIAAQGRLPENLDLERFAVEPPRDPAHGDLSTNDAAMVYARGRVPSSPIRASSPAPATRSELFGAIGSLAHAIVDGGRPQPPDLVSPCGVAAGEARPITLKRAFCSSVNEL
jgi:hypothetical protein